MFSVALHLSLHPELKSMTSTQFFKHAIFSSDIAFRLFSLLLPLELHFLPPFSMGILYEYGRNRSLPHTLQSMPTQKQPTLQLH